MNTIIIHPLPRFHCPFDDAFRVIEEAMLRPTWVAKPVPWWIHEGLGIMGMTRIEEVEVEEEADSYISPFGEVDLDAEKSLIEWLGQETEEEEEKEWVLVGKGDEDDDDLSIYSQDSFDYSLCEVDGPGLPPFVPLPVLPSLPAVSPVLSVLGQEMEPRRLAGEALESVVSFMGRAVRIGRERRRNKGQVFGDEC
ncbi:hypothetical protein JOM56_001504 [Amanita muscaria]